MNKNLGNIMEQIRNNVDKEDFDTISLEVLKEIASK